MTSSQRQSQDWVGSYLYNGVNVQLEEARNTEVGNFQKFVKNVVVNN